MSENQPPVFIVMGVSGIGKSTIAAAVDAQLHWPFQEGDDLHPPANIAKMHRGEALNDADRAPWLAAIRSWIDARLAAHEPGLVTCSALKHAYRAALISNRADVRLLYLKADPRVIEDRVEHRTGHFMPASLLHSQLDALEEPTPEENAIVVRVEGSVEDTVAAVIRKISKPGG